jgi:hypothetical protein
VQAAEWILLLAQAAQTQLVGWPTETQLGQKHPAEWIRPATEVVDVDEVRLKKVRLGAVGRGIDNVREEGVVSCEL